MKQLTCQITQFLQITRDYYSLSFTWPAEYAPKPGQFLEIKCSETNIPLLRRPFAFSAYNAQDATAEIIFQLRGQGTKFLSQQKIGNELNIVAPLGNAFHIESPEASLAIAGGIGLGPMLFLSQEYKIPLFAGFRSKTDIPQFLMHRDQTSISTDDGSYGIKGTVLDVLQDQPHDGINSLFACGPMPMLKALQTHTQKQKLNYHVSLEELMACGIGVCVGCVVRLNSEHENYARVCKEGPIFDSKELAWNYL